MPISLFYHYCELENPSSIARDVISFGNERKLAGRIRISTEGINGTFGGAEVDVRAFHSLIVKLLNNASIDFKVSNGSASNFPEGWRVRICTELVTMGISPEKASWKQAAPHLSPEQFRDEVLNQPERPNLVIVDVRNQYESEIGRFKSAILPPIRQFSDFPRYVLENKHLFRGQRVLMYCTGGIRCERASAFLSSSGVTGSIAQLRGGIDRFLHRFPDGGGVFEGKNLVFDTRMVQPMCNPKIVGRCVVCHSEWDDYSNNVRCVYCRSRILICTNQSCLYLLTKNNDGLCAGCYRKEKSGRS
eukprot:gb/GEZJ01004353.1/.p1 GENE.gb/GEZJ01004353.1/~~gb/GEZJ01004353.1/.p1  ORF type:complete len:303 (-),score=27.60 gb/GEZJ01004353.1/:1081-1989(-)